MGGSGVTNDSFGLYLSEIGRVELLTPEQEISLSKAIQAGRSAAAELAAGEVSPARRRVLRRAVADAAAAREAFVEANLRLVVSIARRHSGSGAELCDVVADGNLGLLRAVEKFDWRKGFRFSTYATWWIRQAISRGSSAEATIRLPAHADSLLRTANRLQAERAATGRDPAGVAELAAELEVPERRLAEVLRHNSEPVSLDAAIGVDGSELGELIAAGDAADVEEQVLLAADRAEARRLLSLLGARDAKLLTLRFGLDGGSPRTLAEVAELLGVTPERVRQREVAATRRLAAKVGAHRRVA